MAKQNDQEKSTQERVRDVVKKEISEIVSKIVKNSVKKAVNELKDRLTEKRISRIEKRFTKDELKNRLDKRLSRSIKQVSKEIAKDSAKREDIVRGIEWAFENGFKKCLWSISRLISLKAIVVSIITLSVVGGGAFTMLNLHTLTVNISGEGTVDHSLDAQRYTYGTEVTVSAQPAAGWEFDCWEGDVSSTSPILTVTMDSDKDITACFTKIKVTLSTSVSPLGSGSVSPSSGTYDLGTRVNVTANPASGWKFDRWGGDASGTNSSITVTMTSGKNITAYFTKIKYTLSTSVSPLGTGSVSPSSGTYDAGTRVNVTANPAAGWWFAFWGGDASGTSPSITVTMTSNKNITAYFRIQVFLVVP